MQRIVIVPGCIQTPHLFSAHLLPRASSARRHNSSGDPTRPVASRSLALLHLLSFCPHASRRTFFSSSSPVPRPSLSLLDRAHSLQLRSCPAIRVQTVSICARKLGGPLGYADVACADSCGESRGPDGLLHTALRRRDVHDLRRSSAETKFEGRRERREGAGGEDRS
eukprot:387665-Hanusia_phi.AAC.2